MTINRPAPSARRQSSAGRRTLENLLAPVGVAINGDAPWDIRVHDERFYEYVLARGTLALGESYMSGWWDCERLDELVFRALRRDLDHRIVGWRSRLFLAEMRLRNLQTLHYSRQVAEQHYDLGNHFFERMLGRTMNYSCAWFRDGASLDEAQDAKMDLVARKLQLCPGDRVLDIGCGWGSMARFAAERCGCEVLGVTISREQLAYARVKAPGLDFRLLDYRDPELRRLGPFDKIVSIGMFEHVGRRNYEAFFSGVQRLLTDDGLFLLHTIFNDHAAADPWINKYIFPNGMLPSQVDLARTTRGRFVIEDFHNFGADYDRTLMAWHQNYSRYEAEPEFPYPLRFKRMWRYYLLTYAGSFRARRRNHLGQIVMSKHGVLGGYRSVR
ncbi:MAG: cyclopropane fatty acyl phospholipid synthase [Pseudomonadota bacterium]